MPISGCHDLPLATFNSPVVNTRPTPEQPPRKKQHRHSGIFRVADLRPGTMPRGKYPESPAPAGSHALISRTPTPGGMLHANLGLPRPPPRNFQPPLPQRLPVQPQKNPPNQKPPRSVPPHPADWGEGLIRCAGRPQEWSFGAVPPREWMARGVTLLMPIDAPLNGGQTRGN